MIFDIINAIGEAATLFENKDPAFAALMNLNQQNQASIFNSSSAMFGKRPAPVAACKNDDEENNFRP